jgi:uncharacterized protein YbjT (DUF2867 family)
VAKALRALMIMVLAVVLAACATSEPPEPEIILVGGATGRQGNAVIDELLARGYRVRGLTRKPDSRKATALRDKGVEVVQGDYGIRDSLLVAMQGIDRMFFYSGFSMHEVQEGRNVISAAEEAGIRQLVYTSGAAAAPVTGLEDAAKQQVELALVASDVPYTVLRPVAFMENFDGLQARFSKKGIVDSRDPDRILHFIAIRDVGFLAAEAFDHPDEWLYRAVNIASDRMTVAEYVDTFSEVMGRPIRYTQLPLDEYLATLPKPLRPLFNWYDEVGYEADVDDLRARYPNLTTLNAYLRATGWENWQPPAK